MKILILIILYTSIVYARFEEKYYMAPPVKNKKNISYESKEKTSTTFIRFLKTDKKSFNEYMDRIEIEEKQGKIKILEIENEMNIQHLLIERKIGYLYIRNMFNDTLLIDIPKNLDINKFDNYVKYAQVNNITNSFDKIIIKKIRKKLLQ